MTKHTPGPWINKHWNNGGDIDIGSIHWHSSGTERALCRVHCPLTAEDGGMSATPIDIQEAEANARLIAAAPELLAALRMFVLLDPRCHHGVEHCGECAACLGHAAIAKAEGRE